MTRWPADGGLAGLGVAPRPPTTEPPLVDPFGGRFDEDLPGTPGGLLNFPRARHLFKAISWGVREGLYTFQQPLESRSGPHVTRGGRRCIMLSSYDYLGLIGDPRLGEAAASAIRRYGTGSGGVRLLTGSTSLHGELERTIADFLGTEAAVAFASGYMANQGALSALLGSNDLAMVDAYAHRSIQDGCRLSGAEIETFAHNDMQDLRRRLAARPHGGRTLIVAEGLYSMDGDICALPEMVALKREFGAFLMIDEAHSLGVLGPTGRGVTEHFGMPATVVDVTTGSLSKAIPANGGFVAGRRDLAIYLQHGAGPFFFSAALCPAATAAATAAIEVLRSEPERVARQRSNGARLRDGLRGLGFDTGRSESPLVPVILDSDERAYRTARDLLDEGVVASAVVFPAVARGAARLRLCATAAHSPEDIDAALDAFARIGPT